MTSSQRFISGIAPTLLVAMAVWSPHVRANKIAYEVTGAHARDALDSSRTSLSYFVAHEFVQLRLGEDTRGRDLLAKNVHDWHSAVWNPRGLDLVLQPDATRATMSGEDVRGTIRMRTADGNTEVIKSLRFNPREGGRFVVVQQDSKGIVRGGIAGWAPGTQKEWHSYLTRAPGSHFLVDASRTHAEATWLHNIEWNAKPTVRETLLKAVARAKGPTMNVDALANSIHFLPLRIEKKFEQTNGHVVRDHRRFYEGNGTFGASHGLSKEQYRVLLSKSHELGVRSTFRRVFKRK